MIRTFPTIALARREMRGAFSRYRLLVFVSLWLLAALVLNYIFWPEQVRSMADMAQQARHLMSLECMALVIGLALAVPSIAAVSITAERDQEMLDQLRLTLISDRMILRGKAFAALAAALAFIIAVMPAFAMVQFSVGLDNVQIVQVLVYTILFARAMVHIGLACSAYFRRAITSLAASYLLLAVIVILPLYLSTRVATVLLNINITTPVAIDIDNLPLSELAMQISPAIALRSITVSALPSIQFAILSGVQLLMSFIAIRIARWAFSRNAEPKSVRQTKLISDEQLLHARRKQFPYYLIDPMKPRQPITDDRNPMLVREYRWGVFQRATWMVRGTYVSFIASFLLFAITALPFQSSAVVNSIVVVVTILTLAIPATLGNAFTKEREMGNFDMLRMTLLAPREILAGKVLGGLGTIAPCLIAILLGATIGNIFNIEYYTTVICGFITIGVCTVLIASASLLASIVAKRTSTAVTAGAVLSLIYLVGLIPVVYVVSILAFAGTGVRLGNIAAGTLLLRNIVSPIHAYIMVFDTYRVVGNWGLPLGTYTWVLSLIVSLGISYVSFHITQRILYRYRMRDT